MNLGDGAKYLGPEVQRVYAPLFQASHTAFSESTEKLQNLFNIHSGGGVRVLKAMRRNGANIVPLPIDVGRAGDLPSSSGNASRVQSFEMLVNHGNCGCSLADRTTDALHGP